MRICAMCRFDTEIDDQVIATATGACICLRCYCRETQTTLLMPTPLRQDIITFLISVAA